MIQIGSRGHGSGKGKASGGKHKIQERWENVPYVVMEKPYPNLPV